MLFSAVVATSLSLSFSYKQFFNVMGDKAHQKNRRTFEQAMSRAVALIVKGGCKEKKVEHLFKE